MAGSYNNVYRLGVDASDFKKKMAQAGVDAENASKKIKKSMTMSEVGSEVRSIMGWGNSSSAGITGAINARNVDAARSQLNTLKAYRDQLAALGFDDLQFGEVSERIKVLEYELNAYEESLQRTADAEREAASEANNLGAQSQEASVPVSKASRELRRMASSGQKLGVIPGFLDKIRSSADNSNNRLEKMVRSIRNISIVSFGLRLVRGLFGELGTIVRQQVSQDAALQAQVESLKSSFGQSLAPAINIATNALSRMMPYVIGVSNAIGTLIASLAGPGWTSVSAGANAATKAIGGAGKAQNEFNRSLQGFDEITRLESQKSGGGGGGAVAAAPMEGKLPTWMTGIVDQLSEAITQGDWAKVGNTLATGFSNMVKSIDWAKGFRNIGSFFGGVGAAIWGAVGDSLEKHWNYLNQKTMEFGGNIWMGIGAGISQAVKKIGSWIKENFLSPMVEGFKSTFKIHSPSTHPEIVGIGKNIMLGIMNGILEPWKDPVGWIKKNILEPLVSAFSRSGSSAKASVDVQANLTSWKDKLRNKSVDFQSRFTTWKDGLKNKVVDFQSRLTTWKDSLSNKVLPFQSNLTSWKDSLSNKVLPFRSNLTSWKDSLSNKVLPFQSNLTSWRDSLSNKVLPFLSNLTSWKDSLSNKTVEFTAIFTKGQNDLNSQDTTFGATARFTTSQDGMTNEYKVFDASARFKNAVNSLSAEDTTIDTKAKITKGWSGKLEEALGISKLQTKLEVETPDIKVTWSESKAPGGGGKVEKPTFSVEFNALGGILDGATLFGMVGNTLQVGGEAGREALLPLDRNTWWMDDIADRVAARMGGARAGAPETITVNVPLDGKVLASTVVRIVNAQARATGKNPLAAYI